MLLHLQKTFITLSLFFLVLFVYTKLTGPIPFSINSTTTNKTDGFSVTGEGISTITPDSSTITIGVSASGPTTQIAQTNMNTNINKVTSAIKSQGIQDKDIQTQNYNVNPIYDYTSGSQRITGFSANTNITIKLDSPSKANTVLDTAISNGATNVGGVSFDNTDKSAAQNEARKKAVEDAKKKAEDAAKIAGFKLGKIINYSENFGGGFETLPMRTLNAPDSKAPTQLEPGTNEVRVIVTLSYEIL